MLSEDNTPDLPHYDELVSHSLIVYNWKTSLIIILTSLLLKVTMVPSGLLCRPFPEKDLGIITRVDEFLWSVGPYYGLEAFVEFNDHCKGNSFFFYKWKFYQKLNL